MRKSNLQHVKKIIEDTSLYKKLDSKNQQRIQTRLKTKDFKIKIEGKKVRCLDWQQISREFSTKSDLFDQMYRYFSLYAHPSNVSVFQFADFFSKKSEVFKKKTVLNITYGIALSSIFLADYISLFPNVQNTFEARSILHQSLLNFYNYLLRGEERSINDTWKKLGFSS